MSDMVPVVVMCKVVVGDVASDIVLVVVILHSSLKSARVPGTVQLNFAA